MQQVQRFHFGEALVRTSVSESGATLFIAADVTKVLGYKNGRQAVLQHCRYATKGDVPHPQSTTKPLEVTLLLEADVWRLVMRSALPDAQKFEEWVMSDVLPTIRKHGIYATPQTTEQMLQDPQLVNKLLLELQASQKIAEEAVRKKHLFQEGIMAKSASTAAVAVRRMKRAESDAAYTNEVLDSEDTFTATMIGAHIGLSAGSLNSFLKAQGVIRRMENTWILTAKYANRKLHKIHTHKYDSASVEGKVHTTKYTKWTEKGQKFIIDLWNKVNSEG